jgi:hypothetical protein
MTRIQQIVAATVVVAGFSVALAEQTPEQTKAADQPMVAIIGCVERVMPPPPPPGTPPAGAPATPPAYKIIDVQPGSSLKQKPMTLATEYVVVGPESIAFSKYQNQWVELTGRLAAPAMASQMPPAARGEKGAAPPATFTVATIKVVATECKQRR